MHSPVNIQGKTTMKTTLNSQVSAGLATQKNLSIAIAEIRDRTIAELAYLRAESRGFATGHELEDWLEAEDEVDSVGEV